MHSSVPHPYHNKTAHNDAHFEDFVEILVFHHEIVLYVIAPLVRLLNLETSSWETPVKASMSKTWKFSSNMDSVIIVAKFKTLSS